jgi:hypothetical protein
MMTVTRWFSRASRISLLALAVGTLALGQSSARAAFALDLTTAGASGTVDGAKFFQINNQSTGSGVIDSFVRIHKDGIEQGYNTDGSNGGSGADENDAGNTATFNHSLLLTTIPKVTIGGVVYREFLLDINQANDPLLSLDKLQVFQTNNASLTGYNGTDFGAGNPMVYNMTSGSIALNYSLESGSGSGDVLVYIQDSLFQSGYADVVLYSKFGATGTYTANSSSTAPSGNYGANDGFEEWATVKGGFFTPTPGPSTAVLAMAGLGLLGVPALRRFRRVPAVAVA